MSSTPRRQYALVSPNASPKSPAAENLNLKPHSKRLFWVALVASGLCFVGAALVMKVNFSRRRGFLSPASATQIQEGVIVRDEMSADVVSVPIIIRDFQEAHPDFENHPWNIDGYDANKPTLGIVQDKLGSDGKPVYNGGITVSSEASFNEWFNDVPGINRRVEMTLNLTRSSAGTLVADHPDFFPIDFLGDLHPEYGHNYWFTLEMHTAFKYFGGEKFTFRGDDDLWVFINGSLVLDVGGMHLPLERSIELDTLGLNKGQSTTLDLFFAERHTKESNFRVETTIRIGQDLCTDYPHMELGTVARNNLGSLGPDDGPEGLVYRGSKKEPNEELMDMELAVSVKSGSTYEKSAKQNGLFGNYGFVIVKAGTNVALQFSFRNPGTETPVLLSEVHISFLDLDQGALGTASEYVEIGGHTSFLITPETELKEEVGASGRTRFSATLPGSTTDNPKDPNLLTVQQRNRVVTLTFTDTTGMEATLGCSTGLTDCDFLFAVEPSLLCSKIPGGGTAAPAVTQTVTTTTKTFTTSTITQTEQFCVIEIDALNIRILCWPEKQWWMFWK